ncbi:MAG: ATP cone domain-containing protein, partial [Thermoleophilia bacterium]
MSIPPITQIRSRDGRLAPFDPGRIRRAVSRAVEAVGTRDGAVAASLAQAAI